MYAIYGNITINIPQMLAYIQAPWILWVILQFYFLGGTVTVDLLSNVEMSVQILFFLGGVVVLPID